MATSRRAARGAAALALAALLAACSGTAGGEADAPPGTDASPIADTAPPDLVAAEDVGPAADAADASAADAAPDAAPQPTPDLSCGGCHVLAALQQDTGAGSLAPGLWAALAGEGLVRYDPSAPLDGRTRFAWRWPARGTHPPFETPVGPADCAECHPVQPDGRGHAATQYGAAARAAAHEPGGAGCADACHTWLPEEQLAAPPFAPPGAVALEPVPGRPAALLAAADTGHARLWREGFRTAAPRADLRVWLIAPGCAGCHGVALDRHGAVPDCLDCHDFGGQSGAGHQAHVGWVVAGQAANDPSPGGRSPCLYCHDQNDPAAAAPDDAYRAACLNCHLGGHQPVAAGGGAHFWPLPE